jgi:hypothetical protein
MWPGLIENAKKGGLDVIQTYVFWNVHEPIQGQVGALFFAQHKPKPSVKERLLQLRDVQIHFFVVPV